MHLGATGRDPAHAFGRHRRRGGCHGRLARPCVQACGTDSSPHFQLSTFNIEPYSESGTPCRNFLVFRPGGRTAVARPRRRRPKQDQFTRISSPMRRFSVWSRAPHSFFVRRTNGSRKSAPRQVCPSPSKNPIRRAYLQAPLRSAAMIVESRVPATWFHAGKLVQLST